MNYLAWPLSLRLGGGFGTRLSRIYGDSKEES